MMGAGFDDQSIAGASHDRVFELLDRLIDMSPTDPGRAEVEDSLHDSDDGVRLARMQAAFDAHPDAESAPDLTAAVLARLSADDEPAAAEPESGYLTRLRTWLGLDGPGGRTARAPMGAAVAAVVVIVVVLRLLATSQVGGGGLAGAALSHPALDPRLIAAAVGAVVAFAAYLRWRDR